MMHIHVDDIGFVEPAGAVGGSKVTRNDVPQHCAHDTRAWPNVALPCLNKSIEANILFTLLPHAQIQPLSSTDLIITLSVPTFRPQSGSITRDV